jgi:hypothetical protein
VVDGWCWFVLREKYRWLVAGGWFVLRENYCWLVVDKPSEQPACWAFGGLSIKLGKHHSENLFNFRSSDITRSPHIASNERRCGFRVVSVPKPNRPFSRNWTRALQQTRGRLNVFNPCNAYAINNPLHVRNLLQDRPA